MKKNIVFYDTTLREGFQTPGVGATDEERVKIAKLLSDFYRGSAVIEIGMPANEVDYTIIQSVIKQVPGPQYAFLLRCHDLDVKRAREIFSQYPNNLAHLFIGTSKQHRDNRFKNKLSIDEYCSLIKQKIREVSSDTNIKQIMFSPEDALRTFWEKGSGNYNGEILSRFIDAALEGYIEGNRAVGRVHPIIFNLPDTVGIGTVSQNKEMMRFAKDKYSGRIDLSVHVHDDINCATASTIDSVMEEEVTYPQVAFAGSGERNGIAKAEPVIAALNENALINLAQDQAKSLTPTARMIAKIMGINLDPRYPIVGIDANVSTAGVHTQISRKDSSTYHFMGEKYGNPVRVVFGTTSGSDTSAWFLEKNGYQYTQEQVKKYTDAMKRKANSLKNYLTETEMEIMAEHFVKERTSNGFRVDDYRVISQKKSDTAEITLDVILDGQTHFWAARGVGPVDATFKLLAEKLGYKDAVLSSYKTVIKGDGEKASEQVMSSVDYNGKTYWGRGISDDVTKAPVDSVVDAFHNMHFLLNKPN